tara:strand:+ start:744 stop:929 length:186 start_codon:yes stop_codon:yes gene_type:complete
MLQVRCIDAGSKYGTGDGLLTENKLYDVHGLQGGYYIILCDDGVEYTKAKARFTNLGAKHI